MKKKINLLISIFATAVFIIGIETYATKHIIKTDGSVFSPDTVLNVQLGDTIRWEWTGGSHTTTSVEIPDGTVAWDNPLTDSNASFEYKIIAAGTYTYKCSKHESAGMKGIFVVNQVTSKADPVSDFKESIRIFPNPVSDHFQVAFDSKEPVDGEIVLRNLLGKECRRWKLKTSAGNNRISFPMDENPAGIYFIELHNGKMKILTKKIIKK